jgi:cobalt-zinc-cadmium efflux system protein
MNHISHDHFTVFSTARKLKYALIISLSIFIAEVIGGIVSNSLALLSDAGHVLTDMLALGLSWFGVRQAARPADRRMTFGYHRIGVVIAIVNAVLIFIIAGVILFEAYQRFLDPPDVNFVIMLPVAVVGLIANVLAVVWLRSGGKININVRSAFWHSMGDALASVGVIIGGILIALTGMMWLDVLISILISLIILVAAVKILKEGLHILVEASPRDIDIDSMIQAIVSVPGVKGVHDLHVWSISSNWRAMNAHILIEEQSTGEAEEIRYSIEKILRDDYRVEHTTLQMESRSCGAEDVFCRGDRKENDQHKAE